MGIRELVNKKYPWFIQKVNEHLESGATMHPAIGHFRPSAFSMLNDIDDMCIRGMFYDYIGVSTPAKFPIEAMKRMNAGTAHHEMWERQFKEAGILVTPGAPLRMQGCSIYQLNPETKQYRKIRTDEGADYPDIRGTCDWCIQETPESEKELIEWKSGYKNPKFGHILQLNIYLLMLGLKKGWVVPEPRDTADPLPYPVERDDKLLSVVFKRLRYIENCAKNKEVPQKEEKCVNGKWKPKDCPSYEFCYSSKGDSPWT